MTNIAISTRNISKSYFVYDSPWKRMWNSLINLKANNVKEIKALDKINIEVKRGEAVAIIGVNGSGKSTLLEILTGTLSPSKGSVEVNGRISGLLELGSGFNPEYSGRENVILNGLVLGLKKSEILNKFNEVESFAEIGEAIDYPIKTYSSGMIMRLAFAVQVLSKPDILIIDEALSVGDFFFQQKCFRYIRQLCDQGVTLIFVSHDMGAVRDICRRGVVLKNGRIFFDGEKLAAIQSYLNLKNNVVSNYDKMTYNQLNIVSEKKTTFDKRIWSLPTHDVKNKTKQKAYILGIELRDDSGNNTNDILMGSNVTFKLHYKLLKREDIHFNFVLKK